MNRIRRIRRLAVVLAGLAGALLVSITAAPTALASQLRPDPHQRGHRLAGPDRAAKDHDQARAVQWQHRPARASSRDRAALGPTARNYTQRLHRAGTAGRGSRRLHASAPEPTARRHTRPPEHHDLVFLGQWRHPAPSRRLTEVPHLRHEQFRQALAFQHARW
jgi:hypothetical protein